MTEGFLKFRGQLALWLKQRSKKVAKMLPFGQLKVILSHHLETFTIIAWKNNIKITKKWDIFFLGWGSSRFGQNPNFDQILFNAPLRRLENW